MANLLLQATPQVLSAPWMVAILASAIAVLATSLAVMWKKHISGLEAHIAGLESAIKMLRTEKDEAKRDLKDQLAENKRLAQEAIMAYRTRITKKDKH